MVLVSIGLNLAMQPALAERDMRVQNHQGALSCYYLDAFLGLVPLRAHRAEHAFRRRHEVQLGRVDPSRIFSEATGGLGWKH